MGMRHCSVCGDEGPTFLGSDWQCSCSKAEPGQGVLYRGNMESDDKGKDKPAKCGRTFDLSYRSSSYEPSLSVETSVIVRVTSTDAKAALTIVENNISLSEKLKSMYLVSIT
jgi:hypothetical protein